MSIIVTCLQVCVAVASVVLTAVVLLFGLIYLLASRSVMVVCLLATVFLSVVVTGLSLMMSAYVIFFVFPCMCFSIVAAHGILLFRPLCETGKFNIIGMNFGCAVCADVVFYSHLECCIWVDFWIACAFCFCTGQAFNAVVCASLQLSHFSWVVVVFRVAIHSAVLCLSAQIPQVLLV